jgi:hypothetical protein
MVLTGGGPDTTRRFWNFFRVDHVEVANMIEPLRGVAKTLLEEGMIDTANFGSSTFKPLRRKIDRDHGPVLPRSPVQFS